MIRGEQKVNLLQDVDRSQERMSARFQASELQVLIYVKQKAEICNEMNQRSVPKAGK